MQLTRNDREPAIFCMPWGVSCAGFCKATVLIVSSYGLVVPGFAECNITLRWDDDPPYFVAYGNNVAGIGADVSREVMRRLDCNLSLIKLPWARALAELSQGRVDMVSGAYHTPEREHYAYYANTVPTVSPNLLFIRRSDKADFGFAGLKEVQGSDFRLGVQINVSYSEEYDTLVKDPDYEKNIEYTSQRQALWRMLALNRVDGVIADKLTALYEIRALGLADQITDSSIVVSDKNAHYIFSKNSVSSEFVANFDRALEAMQNDGTYSAIVHRYVCPPVVIFQGVRDIYHFCRDFSAP